MTTVYWISTAIISGFLLLSSYTYLFSEDTIVGVRELGFPDFFRIQLAVLKLIAVLILLLPSMPDYVKEWGYAGVGLFLLTAIVAHIAHRDSVALLFILAALGAVLVASRYSWQMISS